MRLIMAEEPPDSPPVGRTMKAAHLAAKTVPCDEIVKAGELVEARFARGAAPSGAARKVLALLIHQAAGDAWKPGPHSIRKRDLRGSHDSNDRLDKIFDELQRTLLRMETVAPDGRPADLVAPVMAYRIEHREDDDRSLIWWEFSDLARTVMQGSDYFAALNRGTILAFESRYATTLYERGCLLVNRRDPRWRGTVDDLREVMGVATAKYRDWADIRRKVVEPACAEVNQLAHFVATYRVDAGPRGKVGAIEFMFRKKDLPAIEAARREMEVSRIGRKARRQGTVVKIAPLAFPD
jgi:Initiator Replication protein